MESSVNPLINKHIGQQKNQNLQNNNQTQHLKGVGAGLAVTTGATLATPVICSQITKRIKTDQALKISENKVANVLNAMIEKIKKSSLNEKGFVAAHFPVESEYGKFLNKNFAGAGFFFSPKLKINQAESVSNKLHGLLHETGHAINANCSKLGNFYWKHLALHLPKVKILGVPLAVVAALSHNKDKENSGFNKITKFLSDNIGIIAAAPFIPGLIDEATATSRALKFTEKVEPSILKAVRKNFRLGFLGHLAEAALVVGGAKLAVYLKDKIASKPDKTKS